MDVHELLAYTVESGASDLHLRVGVPPSVRLHGEMDVVPDSNFLTPADTVTMVDQVVPKGLQARLESEKEIDFALELLGSERFRCNVFVERLGYGAVFRVIPRAIKSLEDLGMPAILSDLCRREKGLVLVTGPTGSGKSTTLAAMVDLINSERRGHILTIEDPIEFVHNPKNCIVTQREVGSHTHSFADALP